MARGSSNVSVHTAEANESRMHPQTFVSCLDKCCHERRGISAGKDLEGWFCLLSNSAGAATGFAVGLELAALGFIP